MSSLQDAFFYVGKTGQPGANGIMVHYPESADKNNKLERADGVDILLKLPRGKKMSTLRTA